MHTASKVSLFCRPVFKNKFYRDEVWQAMKVILGFLFKLIPCFVCFIAFALDLDKDLC